APAVATLSLHDALPICSPPVSGTIVQEAPAGTEPTGWPLPSSVTNNSPSPPSVMLAAPSASPTRSSGSTPGVRGAAEGCGRGQRSEEHTSELQSRFDLV